MGISAVQIEDFHEELDSSEFEYVYDVNSDFYSDGKEQAHLFFSMEDGTEVELRLLKVGTLDIKDWDGTM